MPQNHPVMDWIEIGDVGIDRATGALTVTFRITESCPDWARPIVHEYLRVLTGQKDEPTADTNAPEWAEPMAKLERGLKDVLGE